MGSVEFVGGNIFLVLFCFARILCLKGVGLDFFASLFDEQFQLMVYCRFGLVVWIPGIPL